MKDKTLIQDDANAERGDADRIVETAKPLLVLVKQNSPTTVMLEFTPNAIPVVPEQDDTIKVDKSVTSLSEFVKENKDLGASLEQHRVF